MLRQLEVSWLIGKSTTYISGYPSSNPFLFPIANLLLLKLKFIWFWAILWKVWNKQFIISCLIDYWSNLWHTLISKVTSGFTSNTCCIFRPAFGWCALQMLVLLYVSALQEITRGKNPRELTSMTRSTVYSFLFLDHYPLNHLNHQFNLTFTFAFTQKCLKNKGEV